MIQTMNFRKRWRPFYLTDGYFALATLYKALNLRKNALGNFVNIEIEKRTISLYNIFYNYTHIGFIFTCEC